MPADEPLHFPGYEFDTPAPDSPEPETEGLPPVPHPVNWNVLTSDRAAFEWIELDRWVNWLRRTYGLGPSIIPPLWHRHSELVWELSGLHLHWLCAYDEEQHGSAPLGWHSDFAEARERLHDWVAACGSRLDRDRATRQTAWPGEDPAPAVEETTIDDRAADFRRFVVEDVARRRAVEDAFMAKASDAGLHPQA